MSSIEFAWDNRKANSNPAKHGVKFEEAKTAFLDENGRLLDEPDHPENEDLLGSLAFRHKAHRLIVSNCYRKSDSVIRILSARRATAQEQNEDWRLK